MAEALGKHLAGDVFDSYSAGTEMKPRINQDAVRLIKEIYRIDMEETQHVKLLTDLPENIDIVIKMGCEVVCPFWPAQYQEDWGLDDPSGKSDDEFKAIISKIEHNIKELANKIRNRDISF
jgi:arsenate reductase